MKLFNKRFCTRPQEEEIVEAIRVAELCTSGEIRVHLHTSACNKTVMEGGLDTFHSLAMDKTALRNGVLIYLAVKERQFAIIGDSGINDKVPENFWDTTKDKMQAEFRQGRFVEGLCAGIAEVGAQLKHYFPYESDDIDELPNEISYE